MYNCKMNGVIIVLLTLCAQYLSAQTSSGRILFKAHENSLQNYSLKLEFAARNLTEEPGDILTNDAAQYLYLTADTSGVNNSRSKRHLLPKDMSWMEKLLWGEDGLFRSGELTPQKRKDDLVLRRTMLTWHQRLGITTWFLMGATVIAGQLTLNGNRKFRDWHGPLAAATIAGYSATALLAVLAPPPLIRRSNDHDTVYWHKILAFVHAAGMIALPILADQIVHRSHFRGERGPEQFSKARARAHQITAYVTYAAFSASIITIFF